MPERYRLTKEHFASFADIAPLCAFYQDANAIAANDAEPVFRRKVKGAPVECCSMRWGIEIADRKVINTKSENTNQHRGTVVHGRCLIPMSGWLDMFRTTSRGLDPVLVQPTDKSALACAGLWTSRWHPAWSQAREAFSMLTAPAGSGSLWLHHRMPLLVPREMWSLWLSDTLPYEEVCELIEVLTKQTRKLKLLTHPVRPLMRHLVIADDFSEPLPWWKPSYQTALSIVHRRQFVCPAEFAAESAVNVGRAANVLARLQQHGYLDFRPNPAAEDMEMWALPLQDEDAARAEKWRKERGRGQVG
ncbi:SOS response-associated peptidase family protein [Roseimicrobium sp. ORNL1]|uniref:SOS response-associated peptidase family protein n=1 Tax=Roseimicrobium sp. ORNL1 TaxID=2711231 RepID=UPI0013E1BE25|nr:SOS response-associated peptidase family protein [Roseimicrobium sp. ORNL1]QIF03835.1 hypothetical protein G5S37_20680 [Roseimicrobium sp. ORNL1]